MSVKFTESQMKRIKGTIDNSIKIRKLKNELNNKWISVKDRLPDYSNSEYLVFLRSLDSDKKSIEIMHLSEYSSKSIYEGFRNIGQVEFFKVTHWMDLPEPPK